MILLLRVRHLRAEELQTSRIKGITFNAPMSADPLRLAQD
jgi:hypothetical protein